MGRFSHRFGRRTGLSLGFMAGGIGAIGVVLSAFMNSILLLFISLLIYGAGTATTFLARYTGTEMANSTQRAKAISIAMVSTTLGTVADPNLVNIMGEFAKSIGISALAGPFILAAIAYILAGLVLFILLRPDPLIIARAISDAGRTTSHLSLDENSNSLSINKRGIFAGAAVIGSHSICDDGHYDDDSDSYGTP